MTSDAEVRGSYPTTKQVLEDFVKFIKEDNPNPFDWFEGNIHFYLDKVLEQYLQSSPTTAKRRE